MSVQSYESVRGVLTFYPRHMAGAVIQLMLQGHTWKPDVLGSVMTHINKLFHEVHHVHDVTKNSNDFISWMSKQRDVVDVTAVVQTEFFQSIGSPGGAEPDESCNAAAVRMVREALNYFNIEKSSDQKQALEKWCARCFANGFSIAAFLNEVDDQEGDEGFIEGDEGFIDPRDLVIYSARQMGALDVIAAFDAAESERIVAEQAAKHPDQMIYLLTTILAYLSTVPYSEYDTELDALKNACKRD